MVGNMKAATTTAAAILGLLVATVAATPTSKAVTNEDIRDAIVSVVYVMRSIEDKLERHELRERVLGDQLKKALITLDKRLKLIEPVKGTVSRLDERLAAVETILMQKDERERIQLQKTHDAVEDIHKGLPAMLQELKAVVGNGSSGEEEGKQGLRKVVEERLGKLEDGLQGLKESLGGVGEVVGKVRDGTEEVRRKVGEKVDDSLEVRKRLNETGELLNKYETKLAEYNNRIPTEINIPANYEEKGDKWETAFLQALEVQKVNVEQLLNDFKALENKLNTLPDKNDHETSINSTLELLQKIRDDTTSGSAISSSSLDTKLNDIQEEATKNHGVISDSIEKVTELTRQLSENVSKSYDVLRDEIEELSKVEQVMVQTADSVLDTKRRVEYGVHQILLEVAGLVQASNKEINSVINDRFDNFELTILDSDNGALANLTSKIGQEIDQVWRQIGIMHQQMSASTDTLNRLQNQTDAYVNGSLNTMDSMKGKVGQITGRMSEVDENLNYLLGRLSLVTQEFNQIKSGLGKALDEIRESFLAVQKKVKDAGPGPHKIASNEVDDAKQ